MNEIEKAKASLLTKLKNTKKAKTSFEAEWLRFLSKDTVVLPSDSLEVETFKHDSITDKNAAQIESIYMTWHYTLLWG